MNLWSGFDNFVLGDEVCFVQSTYDRVVSRCQPIVAEVGTIPRK